jgi:hypothetical protein
MGFPPPTDATPDKTIALEFKIGFVVTAMTAKIDCVEKYETPLELDVRLETNPR